MNRINPVTLMLLLIFIYPLAKGYLYKFSSRGLKGDIEETNRNISFLTAMLLGIYLGKKIFIIHEKGIYDTIYNLFPNALLNAIQGNRLIIYVVIMPIIVLIIYKIVVFFLNILSTITLYPALDKIEKFLFSKRNIIKRIAGAGFKIPKAICYVIFAAFVLNLMSMAVPNEKLNNYLKTSKSYGYICKEIIIPVTNSTFAKQLPNIINDSFKIVIKNSSQGKTDPAHTGNTLIYYNGVTLDEGVKSNKAIDEFAIKLTDKENKTYGKAKIIYSWVGNNISYDFKKAEKVLQNDFSESSGAIPAFSTEKGICFDYSCLYVAMCKANGIKVRLVTGEGFNGVSWVSHAWNQVYIPEEDRWVNVDTTFLKAGNYYDSKRFEIDHRSDQIAGQW